MSTLPSSDATAPSSEASSTGEANVPEEKVLVQIEVVKNVRRHSNAERLVVCTVLGYQVIINPEVWGMTVDEAVSRNLVERPMKGAMFFVDAMIPSNSPFFIHEMFEFLSSCFGGKRVRTIKLRGEISQGLFLSFESLNRIVEKNWEEIPVGTNITNVLGVRKYMAQEDPERPVGERCLIPFPDLIPKTDEPHLQRLGTYVLDSDRKYVATMKLDGGSVTIFYDGRDTGFCTRNYRLLEGAQSYNIISFIEKKYRIFEQMIDFGIPMAIQGELYGNKINGNRLDVPYVRFAVFNIYTLADETHRAGYMNHSDMMHVCAQMGIPTVPVLRIGMGHEFPTTLEQWLEWADSLKWGMGIHSRLENLSARSASLLAEGMVVKSCCSSTSSDNRFSAKIISRAYLLKHNL